MAFHRIICRSTLLLALTMLMPASAQDRPHNEPKDRPERQEVRSERREPKEKPQGRNDRPPRPQPHADRPKEPSSRTEWREQRPQAPRGEQRGREDRPPRLLTPPRPYQDDPTGTRLRSDGPPSRSREQAREWQQQNNWRPAGTWQEHARWQEHRARQWQEEHRDWIQRGGYGGYYIPQDHFQRHFGGQHWFRIRNRPSIYRGYPRFWRDGYWFTIVDPWPEFWAETWYASDDVYVDYDNGYYLYNRRHPGVGIAMAVSF